MISKRLWVLLCLLPVTLSVVFPYPLKDFRNDCIKKNNNGECDIACRNFLPNAEISDCSSMQLITFNRSFAFDVFDVSFASIVDHSKSAKRAHYCREWRNNFELIMRKTMQIEAELLLSDEELYNRGLQCFKKGGFCPMSFIFSLTLPNCPNCTTLEDALYRLTIDNSTFISMDMRYELPSEERNNQTLIVLGVIGVLVLIASLFQVLVSTTRKLQIKTNPIWKIPKNEDEENISPSIQAYNNWAHLNNFPLGNSHYKPLCTSSHSSPNTSFNSPDPLLQYPDIVTAKRTALHEMFCRPALTEDEMISEVNRLLESYVDINAVTKGAETALIMAVRRGKVFLAEHLIKLGANVVIPDSNGFSLLHNAVAISNLKMLKMLLNYTPIRGEINEMSKNGRTALMECALVSNESIAIQMANVLLEKRAKIDFQGDKAPPLFTGRTVLHYAAQVGFAKMLQFLVSKAKEIDSNLIDMQDFSNKSALFYACSRGSYESVKVLLEAGANQHLVPLEASCLPSTAAKTGGFDDIIQLLEEFKDKAKDHKKIRPRRGKRQSTPPSSVSSSPTNTTGSPLSNSSNSETSPTVPYVYERKPFLHFSGGYHPYATAV